MERGQPIKVLYGLWYAAFIIGLSSAQFLAVSDRLIYIALLFLLVELMVPKRGFIINIFFALLFIRNANYPGKFYTFYWLNWLIRDIIREFSSIGDGGYYMPITAMCINFFFIILMQVLFTRTCFRDGPGTLFFCLGTAMLTIAYIEQGEGTAAYVILFVILGLLIKSADLTDSEAPYRFGHLLRNSSILVSALIFLAFILPSYNSFDVGDWFRKQVIYRRSIFTSKGNKVGYNAYDGDLGGRLIEDNTPVLRLESSFPVYLKGETKSYYTGRGWEAGTKYAISTLPAAEAYFPFKGKETDVYVQVLSPSKILYVPRYPKNISLSKGYRILYPKRINIDSYAYEYYIYRADLRTGDEYRIIAFLPSEDPDLLRKLSNRDADQCYLSLENVPQRVQQLAKTVVLDDENGYDKAVSLISYLRYGKWEYSMDTSAPPKGANFVEHFLFESKSGYCVHFSTAFVLMARSVGLPARWVKGYNYGIQEGDNSYLICNSHAHAWAEVWFDDYGWVPFEPTPENPFLQGFMNNSYGELIEPEGRWGRSVYEYAEDVEQISEAKNLPPWVAYILVAAVLVFVLIIAKRNTQDKKGVIKMEKLQSLIDNLNKVLIGKESVVEMVTVALVCQGHILIEDVPGLGKTMLVKGLARSMGCKFSRIQFTPDLLPSDVVGVQVYNQKTMEFQYRPGPVMSNIVLADEINRTSPRTQSSLLEAMEEYQVTVDGETRQLPQLFMVMATQNPIEYEGTYPLPEAQLDRFMLRLEIGYPAPQAEREIIRSQEHGQNPLDSLEQVLTIEELLAYRKEAANVKISDNLVNYIIKLCDSTRNHPAVYLGASPRGSLALTRTSKALAWLNGRDYVIPDDIKTMAVPVLAHRIILKYEERLSGLTEKEVITRILGTVAAPTV